MGFIDYILNRFFTPVLKFERIDKLEFEKTPLPKYQLPGDAGMDIRSCNCYHIPPGVSVPIKTNLRVEIPSGWEVQIRSRSGLARKHDVFVLNSPGTIDSGFRGEIKVILYNAGGEMFPVRRGDRIAQLVPKPAPRVRVELVDKISTNTERGEGGYGHTGI